MATKAQLQVELDRLACELMRYNGIDVDEVERLRRRLEAVEADLARFRVVAEHMNKASQHQGEAIRALLGIESIYSEPPR